jgi:hypothetical protein
MEKHVLFAISFSRQINALERVALGFKSGTGFDKSD